MNGKQESQEKQFDWEGAADLTALSEAELKRLLEDLVAEEREVSYRRRILQGRIDLIRTELVGRDALALSPDDLARVLLDTSKPVPPDDSSAPRPAG